MDTIFNELDFVKFSEISQSSIDNFCNRHILQEFIENCIYKHKECESLLCNLSNIYVIIGRYDSKYRSHKNEIHWRDVIPDKMYSFMKKHNKYILGFIKPPLFHNVVDVHLRVEDEQLLTAIMRKAHTHFGYKVFPQYISKAMSNHWRNYFEDDFSIYNTADLRALISEQQLFYVQGYDYMFD